MRTAPLVLASRAAASAQDGSHHAAPIRRRTVSHLPGLLPGIALSIVLAVVLAGPVARVLDVRRAAGFGLVFSVGLIASATLTPFEGGVAGFAMSGRCDLSRIGLAPLRDLLDLMDPAANIALFVPLGLVAGSLPRSRPAMLVLAGAVALPFAIEAAQLVITPLHRQCESADVVDNLTGLVLGLAAAVAARWVVRAIR